MGTTKIREDLFDHNPLPMWIYELNSLRFLAVNNSAVKVYGYSEEEFLQMTIKDIRPEEDLPLLEDNLKQERPAFQRNSGEWRHLKKDGSILFVEITSHLIQYEGKEASFVVARDVTDRVLARKKLQENEEKTRSILDASMDAVISIDKESTVLFWNHAATDIFGFTANEMIGQKLYERIIPPQHRAGHKLGMKTYLETQVGPVINARTRMTGLNKQGEELPIELTITPVHNENALAFVGYIRDLRKEVEDERERLKLLADKADLAEELRLILDSAAEGIYGIDNQGRCTFINAAAARMLGVRPESVIGENMHKLIHHAKSNGRAYPERDCPIFKALETGERLRIDNEVFWRSDGHSFPVDYASNPVRENGKILGAVITFNDISVSERQRMLLEEQNRLLIIAGDTAKLGAWSVELPEMTQTWSDETALIHGEEPGFTPSVEEGINYYAPEWRDVIKEHFTRCIEHGESFDLELEIVTRQGNRVWVRAIGEAVTDDNGKMIRVQGAFQDISHQKSHEALLATRVRELEALRRIDIAIAGSHDVRITLEVILEQVVSNLKVDAAVILLANDQVHSLIFGAGRGIDVSDMKGMQLIFGDSLAGKAALAMETVRIDGSANIIKEWNGNKSTVEGVFSSYIALPLIAKGRVRGVLEVFGRRELPTDADWNRMLELLAGQTGLAIDNSELYSNLQKSLTDLTLAYDKTIEGWAKALDLRDHETVGHSDRVTELSETIAREFGIEEREVQFIRWGALLHDIGKMGIPDRILLKPEPLDDEEWEVMKKHPIYAFEMLSSIPFLSRALDIPYCHHEKWDGTGYPRGLKETQIPLAARIFAVTDVWDALTNDRHYRKAWSKRKALSHIKSESGKHFDPDIVEIFLKTMKQ
jgi:PAS domain S-box-containing protein/putative nucleotidyltransferase with HDIG domain